MAEASYSNCYLEIPESRLREFFQTDLGLCLEF